METTYSKEGKTKEVNIGGCIKSCLIDSNVIAYWVISKNINEKIFDKLDLPDGFKNGYNDRYNNSLSFIDAVIDETFKDKFDFITYDFNIFEVAKAIKDEIRTLYLFKKGVPISRWTTTRNNERFEEEIISEIYAGYSTAQDTLFIKNKINLQNIPFSINSKTYANFYEFYSYILFRIPDLSTQDALIISGCYIDKIDYLISEDRRLRDIWKAFVKENKIIKDGVDLEIKSPGDPMFKVAKHH